MNVDFSSNVVVYSDETCVDCLYYIDRHSFKIDVKANGKSIIKSFPVQEITIIKTGNDTDGYIGFTNRDGVTLMAQVHHVILDPLMLNYINCNVDDLSDFIIDDKAGKITLIIG